MEQLKDELKQKIQQIESVKIKEALSDEVLEGLYSVYPFNKFEYVISHLISTGTITLQEYLDIRNQYLQRNKYLYVFEITAPRIFGETWAQRHLNEVVPELQRPTTNIDSKYQGEYDFFYNNIKIEVKASRAVAKIEGPLIEKALSINSNQAFDMNFQQLKPYCCDVFVFIAVWKDAIKYWVFSSKEISENKYFSHGQHRGNIGEGQLWIKQDNIDYFKQNEATVREILDKICQASKK
jgi:hypothetical protein